MMNFTDRKWVYCLLAFPFLLCSCGGSNDDPTPEPPGPDPEPPVVVTEGRVAITPDASTHRPGALTYHFYDTNGQLVGDPQSCDGQGNYNNDKFAVGTYRVLAVNTSASGVDFRDMNSQSAASAHLSASVVNRSGGFTFVEQPGSVYAVVVNELVVSADVPASHSPVPTLLTRSLDFSLTLDGGLVNDVVSITGILHGVSPSASLFTCAPVYTVADCVDTAVKFVATGEGTERQATISLFGLCDPKGGEAYTNTLYFTLTMADGSTEELTVDLTDMLTQAIADNQGVLPANLQIPVQFERTVIGLDATVGNWKTGGESDKELTNDN